MQPIHRSCFSPRQLRHSSNARQHAADRTSVCPSADPPRQAPPHLPRLNLPIGLRTDHLCTATCFVPALHCTPPLRPRALCPLDNYERLVCRTIGCRESNTEPRASLVRRRLIFFPSSCATLMTTGWLTTIERTTAKSIDPVSKFSQELGAVLKDPRAQRPTATKPQSTRRYFNTTIDRSDGSGFKVVR